MPQSYSAKRVRDRALFEQWDRLPDSHFGRISRESAKAAQRKLMGYIVYPGDPEYDRDRKIFNPVFDAHPIMIIHCMIETDVRIALELAKESRAGFALRSSGHCTAGFSGCDGVMIDVGKLDSIALDATSSPPTVRVGPGTKWGTLHTLLESYGLHVPGGECPDVCVAGYVQGGGYGYTSVTFGMSCDSVLAFEVMLADGSVVVATQEWNYDLWWAMCGGTGGNFGILLSVTYKLVPLDKVFGWALLWRLQDDRDIDNATRALMVLQDRYMLRSPYAPYMNIQVSFCFQNWFYPDAPPHPGTPMEPCLMIRGLWVGGAEAGHEAIEPLRRLDGCITQWTMSSTFNDLNDKLLNYPQSMPDHIGSIPFMDKSSHYASQQVPDGLWSELLRLFARAPYNCAYGYLELYGGTINDKPLYHNAFVHRTSAFNAVMDILWFDDERREECQSFLRRWNDLLEHVWNFESYQNYCSLALPNYAVNYWGGAADWLCEIKGKYDAQNVFTFAQSVCPPTRSSTAPGAEKPAALAAALGRPIARLLPKA